MRIVFMGTPQFAIPAFEALLGSGHTIAGVFTQPDKPKGRGGKVQMSTVKELAQTHGIPVFQPKKIRLDGLTDLQALAPDLCVTAAFGQILSQATLDVPKLGTVNVHASLLPRHRGAAPVCWAIWQDDPVTGITTMMTDAGIDTGDILLQQEVPIPDDATTGSMLDTLSRIGADLLMDTIRLLQTGSCPRVAQNHDQMSYDPMLKKEMGLIDFTRTARELYCQVRAMNPWPCAYIPFENGDLKVWQAKPVAAGTSGKHGIVLAADGKQGLVISTGYGALELMEIQAPNAKRMAARAFLLGHSISVGKPLKEANV